MLSNPLLGGFHATGAAAFAFTMLADVFGVRTVGRSVTSFVEKLKARFPVAVVCNVFGGHRSSYKYWRQPKKPDATRVTLLSLVRETYRESQGSAGDRSIAAMVLIKGIKLSRWRAAKLMKELNIISCQ